MTAISMLLTLAVAQGAPKAAVVPPAFSIKLVRELQGLRPLAYAPASTGTRVAVTLEDRSVRIIDIKTCQTLKTFQGHPQPAYAVAWSDDGQFLATGDESGRIFIWDTITGQKKSMIYGDHQRGIQKLSFNHPRTLLISTGKDDKIDVWSFPSGKKVGEVLGKGANLYSGVFNPLTDNFIAATLTVSSRVYRETGTGPKTVGFLTSPDPQGALDINWNKAGTMIITGEKSGNAVIYDGKVWKKQGTLKGHGDFVTSVGFSPNGKYAVTASPDRTVRVWEPKSLKQVAMLENQSAVGSPLAFTADGKFLLTVGVDDYMQVYSVTDSGAQEMKTPVKKAAAKSKRKGRG